jgi:hypothetical protein
MVSAPIATGAVSLVKPVAGPCPYKWAVPTTEITLFPASIALSKTTAAES